MKIPRDWLEFASKELNREMGLEPPIPLDADDEELADWILDAADFVEDDDTYTMITWVCLGFHDEVFERKF